MMFEIATYGGLILGLLAGAAVCLCLCSWSVIAVWEAIQKHRQRRLEAWWLLALAALERHCPAALPQVRETIQFVSRISLEDHTPDVHRWFHAMLQRYERLDGNEL